MAPCLSGTSLKRPLLQKEITALHRQRSIHSFEIRLIMQNSPSSMQWKVQKSWAFTSSIVKWLISVHNNLFNPTTSRLRRMAILSLEVTSRRSRSTILTQEIYSAPWLVIKTQLHASHRMVTSWYPVVMIWALSFGIRVSGMWTNRIVKLTQSHHIRSSTATPNQSKTCASFLTTVSSSLALTTRKWSPGPISKKMKTSDCSENTIRKSNSDAWISSITQMPKGTEAKISRNCTSAQNEEWYWRLILVIFWRWIISLKTMDTMFHWIK